MDSPYKMTRKKAESIREALWIWKKLNFLTSELLNLEPIEPYDRELYLIDSNILVEIKDGKPYCSQI